MGQTDHDTVTIRPEGPDGRTHMPPDDDTREGYRMIVTARTIDAAVAKSGAERASRLTERGCVTWIVWNSAVSREIGRAHV